VATICSDKLKAGVFCNDRCHGGRWFDIAYSCGDLSIHHRVVGGTSFANIIPLRCALAPIPQLSERLVMLMRIPAVLVPLLLLSMNLAGAQVPEAPIAVAAQADVTASANAIEQANELTEGVEYLTRGPLHEAFAEPYSPNAVASVVVVKEPPVVIDELPPEYRPDGEQVEWIPGYWAWDDERDDYLWISGVWRQIPPNQRWVPGYWSQVEGGYQWVGGFWTGIDVAEVQYLPTPPATLEEGPSSPAPAEDYFYVPGNWVYDSGDYRWQPGFWTRSQENWVWTPSQYVWTPRGCVYRQGFWDYDVSYRGVVFTPVYYQQPIYRSAAYTYRPRYTIDTGLGLFVHLFVRPNYGSYYFGDYYGSRYAQQYRPWVTAYSQSKSYDPFYAHYRYLPSYREANALSWITTQHRYFEADQKYRPPRTIEAQREFLRANRTSEVAPTVLRLAAFGESIDNVAQQEDSAFTFRTLADSDVQSFRERTEPLRELGVARQKLESGAAGRAAAEFSRNKLDATAGAAGAEPDATSEAQGNAEANAALRLQLPRVEARVEAAANTAAQTRNDARAAADAATEDFAPSNGSPNTSDELPMDRNPTDRNANRLREARERAAENTPDATSPAPTAPGASPRPNRRDGDSLRPRVDPNAADVADPATVPTPERAMDRNDPSPEGKAAKPDVTPGQVESGERNSRAMQQRLEAAAETRARTGGQVPPENNLRNSRNGVGNLRAGDNAGSTPNQRMMEERMRPPRPQDWPAGGMRRGRMAPPPGTPGPNTVSPSAIPSDRRQPDAQQSTIEGTRDAGRPSSLPTIDGRGPGPRGGAASPPIGRGTFENLERGNGRGARSQRPGLGLGSGE
jgi:hypothetical protein